MTPSWIPELVAGINILELPLSALEGFVLSRIDGRAPVSEILAVTGLPPEQVTQILERLRALGAVRAKGEAAPPSAAATQNAAAKPSAVPAAPSAPQPSPSQPSPSQPLVIHVDTGPDGRKISRTSLGVAPTDFPPTFSIPGQPKKASDQPAPPSFESEPPRYPPSELEEACDLPVERRRQVLDLFYRLGELDYYEALGIPYDAEKPQVRRAYFALSKAFHPDTMFRKELGSFKAKMEAVFKFLTEGYDTLSRKKSRDEYDSYLRATKATAMAERALSMAAKEGASGGQPAQEVAVPPPPAVPTEWEGASANSAQGSVESKPVVRGPASEDARRLAQEVIAKRLRSSTSSPLPKQSPTTEPSSPPSAQPLWMGLGRALQESRAMTSGPGLLNHHVRSAHEAVGRGDLRVAVEHLRQALALDPTRAELKAEYDSLSKKLAEKLAAEYVVQAQFEAKQGKWASSALAWAKVCEGRPDDPVAFRSAAFALYKVGGDLRSAQKYAQQAVFLAPTDVDARVVLAQIYLTLGLKLNAKRELDTALKLDPASEIVKNLLSDLKG